MGGTIGGFGTRELTVQDNIHACIPHTRVCQEQSPQGIQNRAFLLFRLERFTTTTVDGRRRRSTKEFLAGRCACVSHGWWETESTWTELMIGTSHVTSQFVIYSFLRVRLLIACTWLYYSLHVIRCAYGLGSWKQIMSIYIIWSWSVLAANYSLLTSVAWTRWFVVPRSGVGERSRWIFLAAFVRACVPDKHVGSSSSSGNNKVLPN